jgi:ribA/ribD-fused uncharacterized protein
MKIESFDGEFGFLSNFFQWGIKYDGMAFPTAEHAYQAAKTNNKELKQMIQSATSPGRAKRLGNDVRLIPGWETIKVDVMMAILRKKFEHVWLKEKLIATGDAKLIEGNSWGDEYWGVCNGKGENVLGKLLMNLREELK